MGVSVGRHLVTSRIISARVAAFELIDNSEWGFYYCFILPPTLSKLSPTVRFILLVLGNVQILKLFTIYTFICYSLLYIQMMQKLIILNSIWEPLHYLYFNKWKRMDYLAPPPSQNCKLTKISQNQLIILISILSNIWKIHVLIES